MRAAWYERAGAAHEVLQIGALPLPEPAVGEVRIRVACSGVNPTDIKRRGGARGALPFGRITPGFDAAGVIDAVGGGVDAARIGQRVWVWEAALGTPLGSAAEFTCVPQSRAMALPASAGFDEGAALGVPAITACHGLLLGGELAGETVVVTGGAGAVGNYAIQLAKRMGATVVATARDDAKADDARRAGADRVVPADTGEIAAAVLEVTGGRGARHMLDVDLGAHLGEAWRWLAENGSIASYGSQREPNPVLPFARFMYRNLSLHGIAIFEVPEASRLRAAAFVQQAFEDGALWHRFDRRYPLEQIADAHVRQESGAARGKILIDLA